LLIKLGREVGSNNFSLYGQENNGSTWALARMNMFLHEMDNADIEWGDTINNHKLLEGEQLMKFHIVAANPPFSLDKWGAEDAMADQYNRFHRGVPPKSKGDFAFVTHMIETAYEDVGRIGVIVPHGVLFRGSSEGKIREQLIKENLLEAVIGLPANLFYGTGIPASILIFNKGKGDNKDVLFIDASREYESGKNQNSLREDKDIKHIVDTYKAFKAAASLKTEEGSVVEDKYAYRASLKEIEENDFNLNIPRYVDTFEEEEPVDITATQKEISRLKSELKDVETQMENYLKELNLI
jgi:type I restriction enzyme M protein